MAFWTTEIEPNKRWGCVAKAKTNGMILARKFKRQIRVTFHGGKRPGNRQINATDFLIDGRGRIDPTIDPTWHTNQKG